MFAISRRSFLQIGAIPLLGLSLPGYLKAGSQKRKSVIFFSLYGGPSQIDTYDPKPDAAAEIRGECKAIQTTVPGIMFSEKLIEQAKIAEKLAIVRSYNHDNNDHSLAQLLVVTGHDTLNQNIRHPSLGSITAHLLDKENSAPLPYLFLGSRSFMNYRNSVGNLGILSARYSPKFIEDNPDNENFSVKDLRLIEEMTPDRLQRRRDLLKKVDEFRWGPEKLLTETDTHTQNAINILSGKSVAEAFEIQKEGEKIRDRYGRTEIGQRALLARRLVEAGVYFVGIEYRPESGNGGGWDHHGDIFQWLPVAVTPFDKAVAALVADLDERGILNDVLVLAFGEFGRTYKINKDAGRDHQPETASVLMAGGGVQGGQVYGATDSRGARVKNKPVSPADLLATIYKIIGYSPETRFYDRTGRGHFITEGRPIDI